MSIALAAYRLLTTLAEPLAGPLLRRRARRGKEDPRRLNERLGRPKLARPEGPLVWLHGVSIGESVSLLPLVSALTERRADLNLLVTSGTRTSAELLAKRLPPGVLHQYAPVDGPAAAAAFLDHWRPSAGILVESELWPNLLGQARRRGICLVLMSARITSRSADGWARAPGAARSLLSVFDLILPQDAETEARLRALGAVTGPQVNLKTAAAPLPCDDEALGALQVALGARPVILGASTHPGEEALILEAFQALKVRSDRPLLILAPRHPERGAEVAGLVAAAGLSGGQRSRGEAPGEVYVADTLGELGLLFRLADVVVLGGGWAEGVGGHNPLEPARLGKAVVTGPEVFNARASFEALFDAAAALCAHDAAELSRHVEGLLDNPAIAARMGVAALAHARRGAQAVETAMTLLDPLLPQRAE